MIQTFEIPFYVWKSIFRRPAYIRGRLILQGVSNYKSTKVRKCESVKVQKYKSVPDQGPRRLNFEKNV